MYLLVFESRRGQGTSYMTGRTPSVKNAPTPPHHAELEHGIDGLHKGVCLPVNVRRNRECLRASNNPIPAVPLPPALFVEICTSKIIQL